MTNNQLDCFLYSTSLFNPVWSNENASRIKTTIGTEDYDNLMVVNVPTEWRQQLGVNYRWLEVALIGRGMPFYGSPIRPVHTGDYTNELYESAERFNEMSIAVYSKV